MSHWVETLYSIHWRKIVILSFLRVCIHITHMKWASYTLDLGLPKFSSCPDLEICRKDNFLPLCNYRASAIAYIVEENLPLNKTEHLEPMKTYMDAWTWKLWGTNELPGMPQAQILPPQWQQSHQQQHSASGPWCILKMWTVLYTLWGHRVNSATHVNICM